jgi:hypothetical protein
MLPLKPSAEAESHEQEWKHQPVRNTAATEIGYGRHCNYGQSWPPGDGVHTASFSKIDTDGLAFCLPKRCTFADRLIQNTDVVS